MNYINPETRHAKCATRALTISIISLVSAVVCTVFLPFILSPIAIIMSHISKGRTKTKHIAAQAATVIAIFSLFFNCILIGYSLYRINTDMTLRGYVNSYMYKMYGMTYDQYMDQLIDDLGVSFDFPQQ